MTSEQKIKELTEIICELLGEIDHLSPVGDEAISGELMDRINKIISDSE